MWTTSKVADLIPSHRIRGKKGNMSEFRVASEQVDEMEKEIHEIQEIHKRFAGPDVLSLVLSSEDNQQAIRHAHELLAHTQQLFQGECKDLIQKLRARCDMVDPVTKAPRFGPNMMRKVQVLLQRYEQLQVTLFAATTDASDSAQTLAPSDLVLRQQELWYQVDEYTRQQQQRLHQAQQQQEEAMNRQQLALQQEQEQKQSLAKQQQEQEQARVQELARLAQAKREKQKQLEEQRALINQAHRKRIFDMNKRVQTPGKAALEQAVDHLLAHIALSAAGSSDARAIQQIQRNALQVLQVFVNNIVAKPENTTFRTIRKQNDHYQKDLGRLDPEDGCLLAIGFKLKRVPLSSTLNGVLTNAFKGIELLVRVNSTRASTPTSELSLVNDEAELEPEDPEEDVFFMEEPDLHSDLDGWSHWFENLKEMKEWLEHKIPLIK